MWHEWLVKYWSSPSSSTSSNKVLQHVPNLGFILFLACWYLFFLLICNLTSNWFHSICMLYPVLFVVYFLMYWVYLQLLSYFLIRSSISSLISFHWLEKFHFCSFFSLLSSSSWYSFLNHSVRMELVMFLVFVMNIICIFPQIIQYFATSFYIFVIIIRDIVPKGIKITHSQLLIIQNNLWSDWPLSVE